MTLATKKIRAREATLSLLFITVTIRVVLPHSLRAVLHRRMFSERLALGGRRQARCIFPHIWGLFLHRGRLAGGAEGD